MKMARFLVTAFAVVALCGATASAQSDVTAPGDPIQLVNGTNDGDGNSGPPPGAEGVEHVIDDVGQKYLNFLDLGSGFVVTPSMGPTVVFGARFYTANDAVERDPASYLLEGSLDGVNFSIISEGALSLPEGRNLGGAAVLDPVTSFNQTVAFPNDAAFTSYRMTFPTLKNAGTANSMQIADVELLGRAVPEPSTIALAGLGLVGLVAGRRYRRR